VTMGKKNKKNPKKSDAISVDLKKSDEIRQAPNPGPARSPADEASQVVERLRADPTPWPDVRRGDATNGKQGADARVRGLESLGLATSESPVGAPANEFVMPGSAVDSDGLMGSPGEMIATTPAPEIMPMPDDDTADLSTKAHRHPLSGQYVSGPQVPGQPAHHDVSLVELSEPGQAAALLGRPVDVTSPNGMDNPDARPAVVQAQQPFPPQAPEGQRWSEPGPGVSPDPGELAEARTIGADMLAPEVQS
jgi:hypothetical protein